MKNISVLGATGSIGTQTLDIVSRNSDLNVVALAAYGNIELLEKQVRQFKPELVCVYDEEKALELRRNISDMSIRVVSGMDGLIETAVIEGAELVVTAIVGMIGLQPTMAAIKAGKDIALANKETLVTAGHIIIPAAKEYNVRILPVDSEHSAIFQCLNGENQRLIDKILLTASGGPFRGRTTDELRSVTVEQALKHPNWAMGKKITIDSATMVNKGLEVIEAKWLFGAQFSQVQVVIQPQSLIHSMIQFKDGAIMAQLGTPDMRLPIQYAIYYPERRYLDGQRVDFSNIGQITFEAPDMETFKGLKLAYKAGECGGSMPTVFNAANERAVAMFLDKKIGFLEIYEIIEKAMDNVKLVEEPSISQILDVERATYEFIESRWS